MSRFLKNIKKEVLNIVFKHLSLEDSVVFLFGSFAQGKFNRGSDIDIGIICDKKINRAKLAVIKSDLEEGVKTLRKVDVVDFYNIKDKDFLEITLRKVEIWHQTRKSKAFLNNLKKQIKS